MNVRAGEEPAYAPVMQSFAQTAVNEMRPTLTDFQRLDGSRIVNYLAVPVVTS